MQLGDVTAVDCQDSLTALSSTMMVAAQLREPLREHLGLWGATAKARAIELLTAVCIPDPEHRLHAYPHQLSGRMRQRVMIAIALACDPKLVVADEPTTALDVTVQRQILNLLATQQRKSGMAMVLVTHHLGVVAGRTDHTIVMYAGRVVERATTTDLFDECRHPYTDGLLHSIPRPRDPSNRVLARRPRWHTQTRAAARRVGVGPAGVDRERIRALSPVLLLADPGRP